jgi:hypothetical protein
LRPLMIIGITHILRKTQFFDFLHVSFSSLGRSQIIVSKTVPGPMY